MQDTDDDLMSEILAGGGLGVARVAKLVPSFRNDRPATPSLITRWIMNGATTPGGGRVRLEAARLSGRWVTTAGALRRFLLAQQPGPRAEAEATCPAPRRRDREKQVAAASEELRSLGV